MRRREFITLIGGVAASFPRAVRAQQPAQIRRIGALMAAAVETDQQAGLAVFKEILHQLGWIDGRNVRVEVRWAGGDPATARKDAEELVALPADVILANGQLGLEALLRATRSVPIVFNGTVDPVGSGFIDSLARPGGNATGFVLFEYALAGKWCGVAQADRTNCHAGGGSSGCSVPGRNRPIRGHPIGGALDRRGCVRDQHARCWAD